MAALEHFTAVLGQWVLPNRGLDYAGTDPMMLDLLRWHGAEEVEHRSLVFDVYQHVCGSYWIRAFSMLITAPLFIGWWIAGARYLMAHDPTIDAKWRWRDWLRAAREYRLPGSVEPLVTVPLRYMRPSHHPSDRGVHADGGRLPGVLAGGEGRPRASAASEAKSRADPTVHARRSFRRRQRKGRGSMKVSVDLDTCDGNGVCMSICHEVFDVREDGLHLLQEEPSETSCAAS